MFRFLSPELLFLYNGSIYINFSSIFYYVYGSVSSNKSSKPSKFSWESYFELLLLDYEVIKGYISMFIIGACNSICVLLVFKGGRVKFMLGGVLKKLLNYKFMVYG